MTNKTVLQLICTVWLSNFLILVSKLLKVYKSSTYLNFHRISFHFLSRVVSSSYYCLLSFSTFNLLATSTTNLNLNSEAESKQTYRYVICLPCRQQHVSRVFNQEKHKKCLSPSRVSSILLLVTTFSLD